MSQSPQSLIDIEDTIMTAVCKLGDSTGVSLEDIQKHLSTVLDKVPDSETIQSYLNDAVDKGFLTKLDDGKYKINQCKISTKECYQSAMSSVDEKTRLDTDSGKDKIKECAKNAKEVAKDAKNNSVKAFYANQEKEESKETDTRPADENMNSGSDSGNVNSSAEKQGNTTAGKSLKEDK